MDASGFMKSYLNKKIEIKFKDNEIFVGTLKNLNQNELEIADDLGELFIIFKHSVKTITEIKIDS